MRTLIAIPAMDMIHTHFFASFLSLRKSDGTEVCVSGSSLVYDARNMLAHKAVSEGFDRVLWLDSDMHFPPDLMERLSADMDTGLEMVSAVYFTRKAPVQPVAYSVCHDTPNARGDLAPTATSIDHIPSGLFEVEGVGFGACMMTTDLIRRVGKLPFFPMEGYGEDLSFCRRARAAGARIFVDGNIIIDHIGQTFINRDNWAGRSDSHD